jgi:hypothetical protein
MPLDLEANDLEQMMWKPTTELRYFRPKGGDDTDIRLEALWERVTGERRWVPVKTVLED